MLIEGWNFGEIVERYGKMRFDCADDQFRVIRDSIPRVDVICVMSSLRYEPRIFEQYLDCLLSFFFIFYFLLRVKSLIEWNRFMGFEYFERYDKSNEIY